MPAEPQVDKPVVLEFLQRFQAARRRGTATYVECLEYVLNTMLPRCLCRHTEGADEFEATLPQFGDKQQCATELLRMQTILDGLRDHGIAVCVARRSEKALLCTMRVWLLRVLPISFSATQEPAGGR